MHLRANSECTVVQPGSVAVLSKTIGDIVDKLPEGELSLRDDGKALHIKSGKIKFRLPSMPSEDFPPMPDPVEGSPSVVLKASALAALMRAVTYAASRDDTRPHLAGLNIEADPGKVVGVCTDGHRMALTSVDPERGAFESAVLVPEHGFAALRGMAATKDKDATVVLAAGLSYLRVESAHVEMVVQRSNDAFPPYSKVIPAAGAQHSITVRRDDLVDSVKRIALVAGDKSGGVRFILEPGKLTIVSENPDVGEGSEELDVDYAGPGLTAGCNARYMLDALESFVSDEVTLESNGELDPFKLTAAGETSISVVMPMRCN
jgi:DNA polymerase-3 subunit beta